MFANLIIPALVLGLGLWVIKQKSPTRGLVKWGSILLLATVTLLAVQSPSLAGFLSSAEALAKTTFPEHDTVLGLVFTAFRWVGIIALGVIAIRAFQAHRKGSSVGLSKLNKR